MTLPDPLGRSQPTSRQSSPCQALAELAFSLAIRQSPAGFELSFRGANVAKKLDLIEQPFVLCNVQNHGGRVATLRQNERPARFAHLLTHLRGVRAEIRKRSDVSVEFRPGHAYLQW